MADDAGGPPGLIAALRGLLTQALALAVTRGQLAALEIEEARARTLRWAALGLAAGVLLLAALLTLSLWVAALFWDGPRALALGLLTLAYAGLGVVALLVVRSQAASAPPLLSQTRAELDKDRQALRAQLQRSGDDAG